MKVFYDPAMTGTGVEFDTTRKSCLIAQSLDTAPIPDVATAAIHPAMKATAESLIAQVHDLDYVRAVVTGRPPGLAASNGLGWDDGTYVMAVAHAAGVVAATVDAVESGLTGGTLSSGLHHARRSRGRGFCTFNGIAAAVWWVRLNHDDCRVGIFDVDAHCGGGTASLISTMTDVRQVDVSVNSFDYHDAAIMTTAADYLPTIEAALDVLVSWHPDIVIVNAGVDPIDGGVTADQLAERDHRVAERLDLAEIAAVFTVAGGYTSSTLTPDGLVDLHRATIKAFAR